MSADYVRSHYAVDYKVGERLTVDGRPGVLVSFPSQYLGVRFDGERHTSRCHPTWRVEREVQTATLARCSICGDPGERAACPDRHGWEDHCLTCVGKCLACEPEVA